ncbi:hypothetical protein [Rodentibacter pneumotropicus]|uniref:Uncharacterized protein n=1 Tax=Rodentibacter pneumotropicus TaxID=758 RepID=A0A4S2Q2K5_9PAST|nr:hypothetical protein [Rodentibacter pneumotropicus]NBH76364.1 hypothetical protein [Rodentibacter pneumotropicus]THA04121.1 hypothetical protein D3M73_10470 [Rodentibacter pneumotropicus]THA10731.1 hypothetical protein D3M81_10200 [Rodentibacter pneumotropicus]THA14252.1 hypothetical protein D3M76_07980 [Rodentibacter pneumotropicus]
MNKRKQKQLRRIIAAKSLENNSQKGGQIELKNLQAQVWDLAVQSQQTVSLVKTQGETIKLLNRFFSKEINRLENRLTTDRIGTTLLGLIGGMVGGVIAVFMWILWIL